MRRSGVRLHLFASCPVRLQEHKAGYFRLLRDLQRLSRFTHPDSQDLIGETFANPLLCPLDLIPRPPPIGDFESGVANFRHNIQSVLVDCYSLYLLALPMARCKRPMNHRDNVPTSKPQTKIIGRHL